MKKINTSRKNKSAETVSDITLEEKEQYVRDVAAAFDEAWSKLLMMGDEYGYVTVNVPMSPEEKRMLGNFSPDKSLEDYSLDEMVWDRPTKNTKYFDDKTVIIGHTPSVRFGAPGRFYHGNGFINIDCGCVFGYKLGCICLDTLE